MADKKPSANQNSPEITRALSEDLGSMAENNVSARAIDPAMAVTGGEVVNFSPEEENAVLRKIDWHLLPLMYWVYAIQFADKISLNYASLMGIELGKQGLTPASSQVTYLLLLTSFLLVSLSYHYTEYKNDNPFHSITFFTPWRLRLCVGYVIS